MVEKHNRPGCIKGNRSLLVGANGIRIGLVITEPTQECSLVVCLDKGYDDDEVRVLLKEFGVTAHIRARGEEAKAIKHEAGNKARRWVAERTHCWMNRFGALVVR